MKNLYRLFIFFKLIGFFLVSFYSQATFTYQEKIPTRLMNRHGNSISQVVENIKNDQWGGPNAHAPQFYERFKTDMEEILVDQSCLNEILDEAKEWYRDSKLNLAKYLYLYAKAIAIIDPPNEPNYDSFDGEFWALIYDLYSENAEGYSYEKLQNSEHLDSNWPMFAQQHINLFPIFSRDPRVGIQALNYAIVNNCFPIGFSNWMEVPHHANNGPLGFAFHDLAHGMDWVILNETIGLERGECMKGQLRQLYDKTLEIEDTDTFRKAQIALFFILHEFIPRNHKGIENIGTFILESKKHFEEDIGRLKNKASYFKNILGEGCEIEGIETSDNQDRVFFKQKINWRKTIDQERVFPADKYEKVLCFYFSVNLGLFKLLEYAGYDIPSLKEDHNFEQKQEAIKKLIELTNDLYDWFCYNIIADIDVE